MKLLEQDLYINCDSLIKQANLLYSTVNRAKLHKDDLYYVDDMNRYLNEYERFKEYQVQQYITDLNDYRLL